MPEKKLNEPVPVTTTVQAAFDATDQAKPVRLTLKAGANGGLSVVTGSGDIVIEARAGETATLVAPIMVVSRRLVIDGMKGTIRMDVERISTESDAAGNPIYTGQEKDGVVAHGEVVVLGHGPTDRFGRPGINREAYIGEKRIGADRIREAMDRQAVTIFVPCDSREKMTEIMYGHVYHEPEV